MFEFKFPDVGEGIHEGKILQLKIKPSERVKAGDIIAVVETDKVVAEIPSPKSGILKDFGAQEGQVIRVGDTLAFIEVENQRTDTAPSPAEEESVSVVGELQKAGDYILSASGEGVSDSAPESVSLLEGKTRILATPLARKLGVDLGVDLSTIEGTGPAGRVMKRDILAAAGRGRDAAFEQRRESKKTQKKHPSRPEGAATAPDRAGTVAFSTIRKTIAKNMEKSQAIPTAVVHDYCIVEALVNMKNSINERAETSISYTPFFIKALGQALKAYPELNSTYDEESMSHTIHSKINIGVAVNTDDGLVVPVVKQVESRSIIDINNEMKRLAEQARRRTLQLADLRGGTISITNYGPLGGIYGRPMILPPQIAIVGFGRIHQTPVVRSGQVEPAYVLPVSLAFDHRVIDGASAGLFLSQLLELLGKPERLFIAMT